MLKFEIVNNSLKITNEALEVILLIAKKDVFAESRSLYLDVPVVNLYNLNGGFNEVVFQANLSQCEDSVGTPFTINSFITFVEDNLGFSMGAIPQTIQNLTGITWTGTTAPTGGTQSYQWIQVGNLVTCTMTGNYAVGGVALTQVTIAFPSDLPTPIRQAGITATTGNKCYIVNGSISNSATAIGVTNPNSAFVTVATDTTKFNVIGVSSSSGYRYFWFTFSYFTS